MFRPPDQHACALCGSKERLTGEHKIKASALKDQFGAETLMVGQSDSQPEGKLKIAQSIRSKYLKFQARLCEDCNSSRTQPADMAFDKLRRFIEEEVAKKGELKAEDVKALLPDDPIERLNVFRYFAKLLACHLAEIGAPVQVELSQFAISRSDFNPINVNVGLDETYKVWSETTGEHAYAAHGGLMIFGSKWLSIPKAFYSSVSIGPVQYGFEARLNWVGKAALASEYPEFFHWCRTRIKEAKVNPLTEWQKKRAGI